MECTPHKNRFTDSVSDLSTMRVIKDDKKAFMGSGCG